MSTSLPGEKAAESGRGRGWGDYGGGGGREVDGEGGEVCMECHHQYMYIN